MSDKQIEKKKVTITQVDEPKTGTSKNTGKPYTIYSFKAKNGDGKEVTYKTMSKSIGEKLAFNLECEIEFETSSRQVGDNTYTDHNVSQMWINGEPVRTDSKGKWQPRGDSDSPEKRLSIERQSYMENLPPFAACSDIPPDLKEVIYTWGRYLFNEFLPGNKPAAKPKQSPTNDQPGDIAVPTMATVPDFWKVCKKEFGLMPADVRKELNLDTNEVPVDLKEAYLKLLEARR